MRIEEPDWFNFIGGNIEDLRKLKKWFIEKVEPTNKMLAEGVEVTGNHNETYGWIWQRTLGQANTHTALLINIKPIKRDTPEDVLRDWVKHRDKFPRLPDYDRELAERAKAVLK